MGDVRAEKVAVVAEVREKFSVADAAVLTEYRGLDVPAMAELRAALREAGGEYKVWAEVKNRHTPDGQWVLRPGMVATMKIKLAD